MNDFLICVKSTIDKLMTDLVTALQVDYPDLQGVEVDNVVQTDEAMKSEDPVLLWQFLSLLEDPRDPLYRVEFSVGVRTVNDPGNYTLAALMNAVNQTFGKGAEHAVGDYSGSVADTGRGFLMVISNTMAPQQYDHMAGIRFFMLSARGVRFPT